MKVTNVNDVSLPLAVWLLFDEYDYVNQEKYLSATTLLKPIKHIVMKHRVDFSKESIDVMDMVATSMGSGLHDSIEKAWHKGHHDALRKLGYPERVVKNVIINPTPEQFASNPDIIPVWIEQRATKQIGGWTIGGKFDIVTEGLLQDFKSTSTYSWVKGGRDEEHKLQGSIYRWLHDDKITEDIIRINYIFTDWMKAMALNPNGNYPKHRILHKDIPLLSYNASEEWIAAKLKLIDKYWDAPEKDIPECTDEELWRSDPVFKYYSDPENAKKPGARATKNFDDMMSARQFMAEKGKGTIIHVPGEPKRCNYCPIYNICEQRKRYFP
jgi:hypothetical protein